MRSKWVIRAVVSAYLLILVGLPVGFLLIHTWAGGASAVWRSVSAPDAVHAVILTLETAAVVVPLNALVGIGASLLIARRRGPWVRMVDVLFDVPVAVSPVIIGVSLVLAYSRIGWFGTALANWGLRVIFSPVGIVLASLAVTLPYVVRSTVPLLREIGTDQEWAARTLGAGPWRVLWRVTLPSVKWGVLYGAVLAFLRTLGEFGAVLIVSGNVTGSTQTLPIYIFDSWDQNFDFLGSFAGALELALIAVVVMSIMSALQRRERKLHAHSAL